MAEKDFQSEISRSCRASGLGEFYKIPDQPVSQMTRSRFTEHKPFDCWWALQGKWVPMELKQKRGLSINIGDKGELRPHQEANLLELERLGHLALVVVNFQHRFPPSKAAKLGIETIDRAFACPIGRLVEARTQLLSDSIPLDWWERWAVEMPQTRVDGARGWNVAAILESEL